MRAKDFTFFWSKHHFDGSTGGEGVHKISNRMKKWKHVRSLHRHSQLPPKVQRRFFGITLSGNALDNIDAIRAKAKHISRDYGIKELIEATKKFFFPLGATNKRIDELANVDIFTFEGDNMSVKWAKMVNHTKATQSLARKRHRGDTQTCYYLIKAIEALDAFDKFDFRRLRHDVHALDIAVQSQFRRHDRIIEKRTRDNRRKKLEEALGARANNTDAMDRRGSQAPFARRGSGDKENPKSVDGKPMECNACD